MPLAHCKIFILPKLANSIPTNTHNRKPTKCYVAEKAEKKQKKNGKINENWLTEKRVGCLKIQWKGHWMMYSLGSETVGIDSIFRFSHNQPSKMEKFFCVCDTTENYLGATGSSHFICAGI